MKPQVLSLSVAWIICQILSPVFAQTPEISGPRLVRAIMCEGIRDHQPWNPTITFASSLGRAVCFTEFNAITETMPVFHSWYYRDRLSTRIKLLIQPPQWSTYSSIQLREADQGPWRVDIEDGSGNIIQTLRFSITN